MTGRMTGAEQARFEPPPCPTCGSRDVTVNWLDATSVHDEERHFMLNGFACNACERARR